ncbi:acyl-CoA thioesterase [Clostridium tyrobutyricum]|uniref:acyl-CoA thioesterase n=1 Tax=Clostridium tyrobutyricum TaxID=1519 RepID=UPI001C384243|nr:thioesterase family protein [Clostridium tyrobutyricum]MBV4418110.1 acyl-CoA thioesterase [Clostridium tyrobutyricum]
MYTSTTKIKVRYAETDKMGIAYHSNYYIWFEVARGDFIKKLDITYNEMEQRGILMPLVETYCKYLRPSVYDDELIVETSIGELTPVKIILNYKVIHESTGKLIAKGKTTQTFVNKDFKIVNLQKKYTDFWSKLQLLK